MNYAATMNYRLGIDGVLSGPGMPPCFDILGEFIFGIALDILSDEEPNILMCLSWPYLVGAGLIRKWNQS